MDVLKASIDAEPENFARFMRIYFLYNPLFPSCGDGDGVGFESRVLASWDAAVASGQRVVANCDLKRELLTAAARRVFYLVCQIASQDTCFAGLSLFVRPLGASRASIPTKKSQYAWFTDRLEAYAFLNDITIIFSTASALAPRSSPYNDAYPFQPYYADDLASPVLRFAAPLAKSAFNFREYLHSNKSKKTGPFALPFIALESLYSGNPQNGATSRGKGKGKGKGKRMSTPASHASGSREDAGAKVASDPPAKEPPAAFSQEYFQEIALPATEDTKYPHMTNLAKKAARLQELRKTMNDVSCAKHVALPRLTFSSRAQPSDWDTV